MRKIAFFLMIATLPLLTHGMGQKNKRKTFVRIPTEEKMTLYRSFNPVKKRDIKSVALVLLLRGKKVPKNPDDHDKFFYLVSRRIYEKANFLQNQQLEDIEW